MNSDNILYYSTNSYLSFLINQTFYNGNHYVWCSPVFDSGTLDKYDILKNIPPSSNPRKIYLALKQDVDDQDFHSSKIRDNKKGLKSGAAQMLRQKVINEHEFGIIAKMIDSSSLLDFRPLIYLIPKSLVQTKLQTIEVDKKANPLSIEYLIPNLGRSEFEIIEF